MRTPTWIPRTNDAAKVVESLIAMAPGSRCWLCGDPVELAPETQLLSTEQGLKPVHPACYDKLLICISR